MTTSAAHDGRLPPPRSSSIALSVLVGGLGLLIAVLCFSTPGSPLFQSARIWQIYNSLFGAPLALAIFERWRAPRRGPLPWLLDAAVLLLVALRSRGWIPLTSGHALLFVYVIATTREPAVRITTAVCLIAAVVIKLWFWHDWLTLLVGAAVGIAAARLRT